MTPHHFSRRTMLHGLGVTMALPWMESMRVLGDESSGDTASSKPPTRMAILFAGCGFHAKEWWAKGEGSSMELGKVLAPLSDFRDRMLFIRGLFNAEAFQNFHRRFQRLIGQHAKRQGRQLLQYIRYIGIAVAEIRAMTAVVLKKVIQDRLPDGIRLSRASGSFNKLAGPVADESYNLVHWMLRQT